MHSYQQVVNDFRIHNVRLAQFHIGARPRLPASLPSSQNRIQSGFFGALAPCLPAQPKRGRQSTAQRAKRAEFIERSETVDGRCSEGYRGGETWSASNIKPVALIIRTLLGWVKESPNGSY